MSQYTSCWRSGCGDSKIYVIGGSTAPVSGQINNNDEYDPSTDSWATKAALPIARRYVFSAVVNSKIYVIGGCIGAGSAVNQTTNEEYDPSTNSWATKAAMTTARQNGAAAAVNNKIYVVGGYTVAAITTNEEYDPILNVWNNMANKTTACNELICVVANNKVYAIGGFDAISSSLTINEEYNPTTNYWASKSVLPGGRTRANHCAIAYNNQIFIFSGIKNPGLTYTNETLQYDPTLDIYNTSRANIPTAIADGFAAVINGIAYVIGGYNGSSIITANQRYTIPLDLFWFSKN